MAVRPFRQAARFFLDCFATLAMTKLNGNAIGQQTTESQRWQRKRHRQKPMCAGLQPETRA